MPLTSRTTHDRAATSETFRSTARLLSRLRSGETLTVDIGGDTAKVLNAANYPAGPYRGTAHALREALEALLVAKLANLAVTVEKDLTAAEKEAKS